MRLPPRLCSAAVLALLAPLVLGVFPEPPDRERPDVGRVWQRFERTLPVAVEAANPFDPDEVEVFVELRKPGGEVVVADAFVYQPYERALLPSGAEELTPTGPLEWRVRFTPTERGMWRWRWVRRTATGDESGAWRRLRVRSDLSSRHHGFLRRSSEDPRYLDFDDGSGFFVVGTNLGWSGRGGSFDFERWMDRYAEVGVNTIRVWMPRWDTGLFYPPAELRDWRENMDRAWRLDQVFEMAEARGMHVMLVLLNHGAFSLGFNSGWHLNPFNAALGGPLDDPLEVWSDPEAKEIVRNLFRYVVARWGYSPNLLCWELWNEANLTAPAGPMGFPEGLPLDDVTQWHREMAQTLEAFDPNDHLVSTSSSDALEVVFGDFVPPEFLTLRPVWELPEIDFTQLHMYEIAPTSWPRLFRTRVDQRRAIAGGPLLVAEAGVDSAGPAETLARDPEGEGFHDLLWSGLVAGTFGTGMPWWWDNVTDPQDRYFHWAPIAKLTRGVAFHREGFTLAEIPVAAAARDVRAHVLAGHTKLLAWIKNHDHEFFSPDRGTVAGAQLELPGLPPGRWRARWIDTWSGAELGRETLVSDDAAAPLTLAVPDFSRDVALRIDRLPDLPAWLWWLLVWLGLV